MGASRKFARDWASLWNCLPQGGFLLRVNGTLQETKLLSWVVDSDAFFLRALRKFAIGSHQSRAY